MDETARAVIHSEDVINRSRAPYPAAFEIKRFDYRTWAFDLVNYEPEYWISFVFGPGVDGKRTGPYKTSHEAMLAAQSQIDELIKMGMTAPLPELPAKRYR